jgi:hypothetical protein
VRILTPNQNLFSGFNQVWRDGRGGIGGDDFGDLPGHCVDQPRLALGQVKGEIDGCFCENLPRVLGMLAVQFGHFCAGKVAQGEGFNFDIKGAGAVEPVLLGRGCATTAPSGGCVVTNIAQANETDRLGKSLGPSGIAFAQLTQ